MPTLHGSSVSVTPPGTAEGGGDVSEPDLPMLAVIFPLEDAPWMTRVGTESELRALGAWLFRPTRDPAVIDALLALAAALADAEN